MTEHHETFMKDGLLHCAQCGAPMQSRIQVFFDSAPRIVPCICKCDEERLRRIETLQRQREQEERRLEQEKRLFSLGVERTDCPDAIFAHAGESAASQKARTWCGQFDEMGKANIGLMLSGPTGTGKTFLAWCITHELRQEKKAVLFTSLPALVGALLRNYGENAVEIMQAVENSDLLILDDFGIERNSPTMLEQAYEVIDARYRSGRPLIVTTNLTQQHMASEATLEKKRIYDRVLEMCRPLVLEGKNHRAEIARNKSQQIKQILTGKMDE